ncbi:ABC transporter permease [Natronosporangium hydrolyticum]|uniref:ABC transporter permease n=1 Tax=Natronosporangium hydrolyticum TaxID=2811111 RepID=A0A895YMI8_9ACTN|nr:ABC transporter permease [Natronosporangium hydrolyticum]
MVVRPAIGLAAAVGVWWGLVTAFDVPTFFLPAPPDVVDALRRQGPYLLRETWATLGHTLGGFGLATAAGLAAAGMLSASTWLRETVLPVLVALQAVPKVALAPLLIIWLGFGTESKVALVGLLCFFPIVVATLAGLRATPAELVELARSLSGSRLRTFRSVRLPYAAPQIFTGLKVAVSLALIGAVVAQITTPNAGLGAVIVRSGQSADTPLAFAAIGLLAAVGIGLYYSLTGLERLFLPWARATAA